MTTPNDGGGGTLDALGNELYQELLEGEAQADSWFTAYDRNTGRFLLINRTNPEEMLVISEAAIQGAAQKDPAAPFGTLQEAAAVMQAHRLGGSYVVQWQPGENGFRIVPAPAEGPIPGVKSTQAIPGTDDVLVELNDGQQVIRPKAFEEEAGPAPFVPTGADVVKVPGGNLVPVGPDRFQFVPDAATPETFTPSQADIDNAAAAGTRFVQTGINSYSLVRPTFQAGVVESGGQKFVQQPDGSLSLLPETFQPGAFQQGGFDLFQQRSGAVTQLQTPSVDDLLSRALIDGNFDYALALQDMKNRPTASDAFANALAFARSPADQHIISAIARGEMTVQPPPAGSIQRVGPQPDFLIKAYQDYQKAASAQDFERRLKEAQVQTAEEKARKAKAQADDAFSATELNILSRSMAGWAKMQEGQAVAGAGAGTAPVSGGAAPVSGGAAPSVQPAFASLADTLRDAGIVNVDRGQTDVFGSLFPAVTAQAAPAPVTSGTAPITAPAAAPVAQVPFTREAFTQADGFSEAELFNLFGAKKFARGGVTDGGTAIVGEKGPELAIFPSGTRILPLKGLSRKQAVTAKKRGVRGFQSGGIMFSGLPFGLRQLQAGRQIGPPTGKLLRAAGLSLPSAQAMQNLTPEDMGIFMDLGAQAGIPPGALSQELSLAIPGGRQLPTFGFPPISRRGIR